VGLEGILTVGVESAGAGSDGRAQEARFVTAQLGLGPWFWRTRPQEERGSQYEIPHD
jgi:hypothetical protein